MKWWLFYRRWISALMRGMFTSRIWFIYQKDRIAEIAKERIEGAPDLVLEILSPSTAYYDLRQKKDIYEKYGVKEYIIIDPIVQIAELYSLKDGFYYLHEKAQRPGN